MNGDNLCNHNIIEGKEKIICMGETLQLTYCKDRRMGRGYECKFWGEDGQRYNLVTNLEPERDDYKSGASRRHNNRLDDKVYYATRKLEHATTFREKQQAEAELERGKYNRERYGLDEDNPICSAISFCLRPLCFKCSITFANCSLCLSLSKL